MTVRSPTALVLAACALGLIFATATAAAPNPPTNLPRSAKPVQQGAVAHFTISARDANGGTAPQLWLQITLPAADPLVSAQATVGMTCADTTPTLLDCTQDVLFGPGTAATVALSLRASVTGQIPIAATVQYAYPDPVPANNSTSAADAVVPGCTVPKVVGLSVKQATRLITHAHCRLIRATFVPTRSTSLVGRVVSQLPRAGVHLDPGRRRPNRRRSPRAALTAATSEHSQEREI